MLDTALASATGTDLLACDEVRVESREKVSGQAQYAADFSRDGMLWAAFVASPHARAQIVAIDTATARAREGVRAVLTGADIGERYFGTNLADWPVLAIEQVRFVGEFVAVVAADTRDIAEAAAAEIDVTYKELPGIFDTEAAVVAGAPLVHEDDSRYFYASGERPPRPYPNLHGHDVVRKGDPEAAFATSAHVFEHTYRTPRYHAGYLEPRATLVWFDDTGTLRVLTTSKNPFLLRDMLAHTIELPKQKVVVEPSFIGGDFGAKALTIEEFPLAFLARATKRAVKYVRTHVEDVRSAPVRHASTVKVKVGTTADGMITAVDLRVVFDGGAYAAAKALPGLLPGRCPKLPYKVPNARVERMAVYTNSIPATFVRAPGDVQILFGVESMMDVIAAELGIDPLDFRLRNAAEPGDTDLDGNPFARPRAREVLETLREAMGWDRPAPPGRGRGIALTSRHIGGGKTAIVVTARADGRVTVDTGACEPGVGQLTVIQRVLANELGIDPQRISVTRGDTGSVPFDPGIGGSKGTVILGHAAIDAARKLRTELALKPGGEICVVGEAMQRHQAGEPLWLNFGAYGIEVSVDEETGAVTVQEAHFVADVGTIINPVAHRGQIDGGFLMGLGHALTEELCVEDGRILNPSLSEYKLPCQLDMPPFHVIMLDPDGGPGPYGARAAGEFNTAGVPPAIANAVSAACNVRLDVLAITAERVYEALQRRSHSRA